MEALLILTVVLAVGFILGVGAVVLVDKINNKFPDDF
jgi:uncharacterized protein involved in exopolysaccharide biosynthesis